MERFRWKVFKICCAVGVVLILMGLGHLMAVQHGRQTVITAVMGGVFAGVFWESSWGLIWFSEHHPDNIVFAMGAGLQTMLYAALIAGRFRFRKPLLISLGILHGLLVAFFIFLLVDFALHPEPWTK